MRIGQRTLKGSPPVMGCGPFVLIAHHRGRGYPLSTLMLVGLGVKWVRKGVGASGTIVVVPLQVPHMLMMVGRRRRG